MEKHMRNDATLSRATRARLATASDNDVGVARSSAQVSHGLRAAIAQPADVARPAFGVEAGLAGATLQPADQVIVASALAHAAVAVDRFRRPSWVAPIACQPGGCAFDGAGGGAREYRGAGRVWGGDMLTEPRKAAAGTTSQHCTRIVLCWPWERSADAASVTGLTPPCDHTVFLTSLLQMLQRRWPKQSSASS